MYYKGRKSLYKREKKIYLEGLVKKVKALYKKIVFIK